MGAADAGSLPVLHRRVPIPSELLTHDAGLQFGGDLRIGDLTGDGRPDLLIYRAEDNFHDGGGMKPCCLGAFTMDGEVLWRQGEGGLQPGRPGGVVVHDMDGDGSAQVICLFHDRSIDCPEESMQDVVIQIRDGRTGEVRLETAPEELRRCSGRGANWAHQRLLVANLRGTDVPSDFVIKLGENVLAFDSELNVLWTYSNPWTEYSRCPSYIPCVGDVDGDGRDEVNGGYFLIDEDGTVLWEKQLGRNMDSVVIAEWDDGRMRAICSGYGHVMDEVGNAVLCLGEAVVPHGQELRVGHFDGAVPGPQMMIRYSGHTPELMLVSVSGEVIRRFKVNESPNNTGMEAVYWNGFDAPALLYNGGMLWAGTGELFAALPGLPDPVGHHRQGWYHCIPAGIWSSVREDLVIYNPWDRYVYVFTQRALADREPACFQAGPRQYNVRLMD